MSDTNMWYLFFLSIPYFAIVAIASPSDSEERLKRKIFQILNVGGILIGGIFIAKAVMLLSNGYYEKIDLSALFDYSNLSLQNQRAKRGLFLPIVSILLAILPFAMIGWGSIMVATYYGFLTSIDKK